MRCSEPSKASRNLDRPPLPEARHMHLGWIQLLALMNPQPLHLVSAFNCGPIGLYSLLEKEDSVLFTPPSTGNVLIIIYAQLSSVSVQAHSDSAKFISPSTSQLGYMIPRHASRATNGMPWTSLQEKSARVSMSNSECKPTPPAHRRRSTDNGKAVLEIASPPHADNSSRSASPLEVNSCCKSSRGSLLDIVQHGGSQNST